MNMWFYLLLSFVCGIIFTLGALIGAGKYAFTHPKVMSPIARRMVHASMKMGKQ